MEGRGVLVMRTLTAMVFLTLIPISANAADPIKTLKADAEAAFKAGELETAADHYRKLCFVQPSRKSQKGLKKVIDKLTKQSIKDMKKAVKKDPLRARKLALQVLELNPKSKDAKKIMKRLSYVRHGGRWVLEVDLPGVKEEDKKRGSMRRMEIGLGSEFVIFRHDVFRFYTNVDLKYGQAILDQLFAAMVTHYQKYREIMGPLGVRIPTEGLDVVLFDDEKDYMALTKASGSAGVYIPRKSAGFFFSGSAGFNFPTMMHEMTHQLNDKVLEATANPPWWEEGISEYFGAGLLSNKGRAMQLGLPDRSRMATFRGMMASRPSQVIPLEQFFQAARAELTSEYYAQSWALTHYLMEGGPLGRLVVYDLLKLCKTKRQQFGVKGKDFVQILEKYGMSLEFLEEAYVAFQSGGVTTLKASAKR